MNAGMYIKVILIISIIANCISVYYNYKTGKILKEIENRALKDLEQRQPDVVG